MDYLPISKVNTVAFCPRRYYIEMLLADTETNHHVTEGQTLHDRTKRVGEGIWVWHDELGLVGIVDQIKQEGEELVITEFKKGYLADHKSDQLQLCALAMCYEYSFTTPQDYGYIYYHQTRRKQRVDYTPELRHEVYEAVDLMKRLERSTSYPPITDNPNKCKGCSVKEACQPSLLRKKPSHWNPTL